MYGSASELRATLEYDFSQEKDFSYKGLSMDEIIHHWQSLFQDFGKFIFWRRQYKDNSSIFYKISQNTWLFCNQ